MSETRQNEQDVERLLQAAGKRPEPPPAVRARVYANTLAAWQALPQATPAGVASARRSAPARYAMAATVLVAVLLGVVYLNVSTPGRPAAAEIVFAGGAYVLNGEHQVAADADLALGSAVQTEPGTLLSLRMPGGAVVTLDQRSEVVIRDAGELFVTRGRVYVDAADEAVSLTVSTPYGSVVDVGTQYEVAVERQATNLFVAVREGRIMVTSGSGRYSASAAQGQGEGFSFDPAGRVRRVSLATTAPHWEWRKAGREPFVLDGASVHAYLTWMARDSGHQVVFASRMVEQMAKLDILRGPGTSDETSVDDTLSATRFELNRPAQARWVVNFRS